MATPRVPLVAGNWKMHPASRSEAILLARGVAEATRGLPVRTVVCPPDVFLEAVSTAILELDRDGVHLHAFGGRGCYQRFREARSRLPLRASA